MDWFMDIWTRRLGDLQVWEALLFAWLLAWAINLVGPLLAKLIVFVVTAPGRFREFSRKDLTAKEVLLVLLVIAIAMVLLGTWLDAHPPRSK